MAHDGLMATNCALSLANRVTTIYTYLPLTCRVLGPDLDHEIDAFWNLYDGLEAHCLSETVLFARFLRGRLQDGSLSNPYLREIVDYEAAAAELRFAHGDNSASRLVRFTHDPLRLLDALSNRAPIPNDLECGEYRVMLDGSYDSLHVRVGRVM
jgi:hypothetical protein